MVKAYLNVHIRTSRDGIHLVKAHIGPKPGWQLGAEEKDCFWAVVIEQEADTYERAQAEIEFLLDRGDMRQFAGFVLLKKAVEKSLGRPIGDGTIAELHPLNACTLVTPKSAYAVH